MNRAEDDIRIFKEWKKSPTPSNLAKVLKQMDPIISSEVIKQLGTVPVPILKVKAKNFVIKALPKFDPNRGIKLSTYVVQQLKPLRRINYEQQNLVRLPENRQLKVANYKRAIVELERKYRRDPTTAELADYLSWSTAEVGRMERQLHSEIPQSSMVYEPGTMSLDQTFNKKIDFIYYDLDPRDKIIFEHMTGYGNKLKLSNFQIAQKLRISSSAVSQRKKYITNKIKQAGI